MASLLRDPENKIQGCDLDGIIHLLNQFADDADIASLFKQESLDEIMRIFDTFGKSSGFLLSYEKTTIYRIGSLKNTQAKLYTQAQLNWTNEPINILGVWVHYDINKVYELNYKPILDKVRSILNSWSNRGLSLCGKILIVNQLIASLFVYKIMVLPTIPVKVARILETEIGNFLWNGRRAKIPLKTLQLSKKKGGLALVDIRKRDIAIKCSWIKILEDDRKIANLAYYSINPILNHDIWHCNFKADEVDSISCKDNVFWKDVMRAWAVTHFDSNPAHLQSFFLEKTIQKGTFLVIGYL